MAICGIYARTSIETEGTSIEQQIELGIKFCKANDFEFQVYQDAGKSGYKMEDENDPFKNRAGLQKLIEDVEKKTTDKIWVFEHSRLSRNQYAWYVLRRIFERNKVEIYENGKLFQLDDPQSQMIQGILAQVSQYERHLIVRRTTRGIHDRINTGRRSYISVYGYRQLGKTDKFMAWEPVRSEIENIKFAFESFLDGNSINSIVKKLHSDMTEIKLKAMHRNYRNILFRFDYTGFSLTTEGAELCNRYKKLEIDSLDFLNKLENGKPKYYVPSINYPVKIVSVENWITSVEKLLDNRKAAKNKRVAKSDIFSGIIRCPYCGLYYYPRNDHGNTYRYYSHIPSRKCLQKPKSSRRERINSLVDVFYFYYYLVYEDTNEFLKESQTIANLNIAKVRDRLSLVQSENRKVEKQISNLQSVYEDSTDKDLWKLTLTKEAELKMRLDSNSETVAKLKSELSRLEAEFKKNLKLLTYESVKNLIIGYFEKLGTEDKRKALLKIIKECVLFKNYLLINTGKMLFIFDIRENYELQEAVYEDFKNDAYFKSQFINREDSKEKYKLYLWTLLTSDVCSMYNMKNPEDEKIVKDKLEAKEIDYKLSGINSVFCFTEL